MLHASLQVRVIVCAHVNVHGRGFAITFKGALSFSWTLGSVNACHQNVHRICGVSAVLNILSANVNVQTFPDQVIDNGAAQFIIIHAKLDETSF